MYQNFRWKFWFLANTYFVNAKYRFFNKFHFLVKFFDVRPNFTKKFRRFEFLNFSTFLRLTPLPSIGEHRDMWHQLRIKVSAAPAGRFQPSDQWKELILKNRENSFHFLNRIWSIAPPRRETTDAKVDSCNLDLPIFMMPAGSIPKNHTHTSE